MEIIELERQQFKKKEYANKEVINEISKRLKVLFLFKLLKQNEKRIDEESKISVEYKRRYEALKKKYDKLIKEKSESGNQLKSLFFLFT